MVGVWGIYGLVLSIIILVSVISVGESYFEFSGLLYLCVGVCCGMV